MTDEITHARGCWSWGARHYECAEELIGRQRRAMSLALGALTQPQQISTERAIEALQKALEDRQ